MSRRSGEPGGRGARRWGLVAVALVLSAAGCSAEASSTDDPGARLPSSVLRAAAPVEGAIAEGVDLRGVEVWVGSTADTPATDALLGALTVQVLTAAGADVHHLRELSGVEARDALLSGEIDLYWEGAGDAWTLLLRQPVAGLSGEQVHRRLAELDLEENGVAWLDSTGVDDGPRFAESASLPARDRTPAMSDLATWLESDDADGEQVCVTGTFQAYPDDGRVAVQEALGIEFDDEQLSDFEAEPIYPRTADGTCRFGLVGNTSGRLVQYDLTVLEDDVGAFLPNPLVPAVREEVLLEHAEIGAALNTLVARLDAGTLRRLNRRLLPDDATADGVARRWLDEQGLVPADPADGDGGRP